MAVEAWIEEERQFGMHGYLKYHSFTILRAE